MDAVKIRAALFVASEMRVCLRDCGALGGFSAPGGIAVKKKMLELEQQSLALGKMSNYV